MFSGIFKTLETGLSKLGNTSGARTKAIRDLLYLINEIPMDGKQDYDVLGFIYEYLIGNFAANASDADIFVSIHCNAAETEEANGTETWACAGSYRGSMLANCIQCQLVDALDTTDRGVKIATPGVNGLYVLTNTDMPAVLVELAFITNPGDEDILANTQDALARAVARGVTDYEQLILGDKRL